MRLSLAALSVPLLICAGSAHAVVTRFDVFLNGANEVTAAGVPNQGDTDGFGVAVLFIDDATTPPSITWNITVNNIVMPLTGAHIHEGPRTTNGPVRIDFNATLNGSNLQDADLAGVLANPTNWYVNIHNGIFPAGAIRGQIPAPSSLVMLALAPLARRRRR